MSALSFPFYAPGGDRYGAAGTRLAYRFFGAALVALAAAEVLNRQWDVQAGMLCARRLLPLPMLPAWTAGMEWLLMGVCGAAFLTGRPRPAFVRTAACVLVWSAGQRYMNQKAFLALVLTFLALDPPDPDGPAFEQESRPNLTLAVWQLAILYAFSAVQKVRGGFLDGHVLADTFAMAAKTAWRTPVPAAWTASLLGAHPVLSSAACWTVVAAEAVLPVLLWLRPRVALAAACLLHAAFALMLPDVAAFSLAAVGCAVLGASRRL
ncbi:MAG: hypothetical protein HY928_06215 [Elusimicrobia bacterium]|nr:hypothetical protein [Elusimicrobiota bacterium]